MIALAVVFIVLSIAIYKLERFWNPKIDFPLATSGGIAVLTVILLLSVERIVIYPKLEKEVIKTDEIQLGQMFMTKDNFMAFVHNPDPDSSIRVEAACEKIYIIQDQADNTGFAKQVYLTKKVLDPFWHAVLPRGLIKKMVFDRTEFHIPPGAGLKIVQYDKQR